MGFSLGLRGCARFGARFGATRGARGARPRRIRARVCGTPQRDAAARRGMATRGDDPSSDDAPCTLPIGAAIAALAAAARETWMTARAARE